MIGVEAQSKTVWRQANRYKVPRIAYINKMDKTGADIIKSIQSIVENLDCKPILVQFPNGEEENFKGIIDLIRMEKISWEEKDLGKIYHRKALEEKDPLYTDCIKHRNKMIEDIAEIDEKFGDIYLSGETIQEKDIKEALKRITLDDKGVVVLCGSSFKNKGVQLVMDSICEYLPSPDERPLPMAYNEDNELISIPLSDDAPFFGLAFKVIFDPNRGALVFVRVYSGSLKASLKQPLFNTNKKRQEKFSKILQMHANVPQEIQVVSSGNIAVLVGLKHTSTGDTLTLDNRKNENIVLQGVNTPKPVFFCSIEPESTAMQEQFENALNQLQLEDPSFQVTVNNETGQTLISGMGELHLDIIADRLKREFKLNCFISSPQISYRETLSTSRTDSYTYDKIINGKVFHAKITLTIEPGERGKGNVFKTIYDVEKFHPNIDAIRKFSKDIEKSVMNALTRGSSLMLPFEDVKITLIGASINLANRHDNNLIALGAAASLCISQMIEAISKDEKTTLLEPIMNVEVRTDTEYIGKVLNDLSSGKRGNIKTHNYENGENVVQAEVPLSELIGYASYVRSMTSGNAHYFMEFYRYEELNQNEQKKVIKKIKGF